MWLLLKDVAVLSTASFIEKQINQHRYEIIDKRICLPISKIFHDPYMDTKKLLFLNTVHCVFILEHSNYMYLGIRKGKRTTAVSFMIKIDLVLINMSQNALTEHKGV